MAKYVMALDAGTTSNRCILFNEKGEIKTLVNMEEVYTDLRLIGRLDAYSWLSE